MKTLTVRLPEPLVADIEAESRGRKISKSDVVRERLQRASRSTRRQPVALDAIADLIGSVDGLPADLSARKKQYLSTCEAALSEAFYLVGARGAPSLSALHRRRSVLLAFNLAKELEVVLKLMQKYSDVPMSLADACLVRMTETFADPVVLTTDADFRVYRRHSRHVVPCVTPN